MVGIGTANAVPAAQIVIAVIPIVGIVMGAVVVFFYLLWRHRQIVRQIQAGIYKKPVLICYCFACWRDSCLRVRG